MFLWRRDAFAFEEAGDLTRDVVVVLGVDTEDFFEADEDEFSFGRGLDCFGLG